MYMSPYDSLFPPISLNTSQWSTESSAGKGSIYTQGQRHAMRLIFLWEGLDAMYNFAFAGNNCTSAACAQPFQLPGWNSSVLDVQLGVYAHGATRVQVRGLLLPLAAETTPQADTHSHR